jgi:hypothetical protein
MMPQVAPSHQMAKMQSFAVTGPRSKRTASRNSNDKRIGSACWVQVPIDGLGGRIDSLAPIDGDRAVEKERFSYRQTSVSHVRLKCRGKGSARSFCHNCSCAAASSPVSGRDSTYRPVRIWPTTSLTGSRRSSATHRGHDADRDGQEGTPRHSRPHVFRNSRNTSRRSARRSNTPLSLVLRRCRRVSRAEA